MMCHFPHKQPQPCPRPPWTREVARGGHFGGQGAGGRGKGQRAQPLRSPTDLSSFFSLHRQVPLKATQEVTLKLGLKSEPRTGPSSECCGSAQREPPAALEPTVSTVLVAVNWRPRQRSESPARSEQRFQLVPVPQEPPKGKQPPALRFSLFWPQFLALFLQGACTSRSRSRAA